MTPVGCAVGPPITGQLTLEGIPVLGLVDTGASVTCMGFSVWWRYRAQWGPLKPFGGVVHGAHGKPLQIAGKTQHLNLQWDEARRRACFIVIIGLESPPCLIGMDIMRPLCVRIDVTNGTATPAQLGTQTIHLNAAQQQDATPPTVSRALLLQTTDIHAETKRLVRCLNPWPSEDVYFCPEDALPAFVTRVPAISSDSEVWIAIHNHCPEPLRLHSGQNPRPPNPDLCVNRPYQSISHRSSSDSWTASSRSSVMYSAKGRMTLAALRCWSTRSRPTGLHSASLIGDRTQLFGGKRWRRSSKCWPATSSGPPTVPRRRW